MTGKEPNPWPLRLKLEAAIWGQPAPVLAVNGFLSCPRGNPTTQMLVGLYNRLFGEKNRRWLAAGQAQSAADTLQFWAEYELEKARLGPLRPGPAGVVLVLQTPRRERRENGGKEEV